MGKKGGGGGGFPGDLMGMLQQAQKQAEQMKSRMESQLRDKTVEGSTGGGMVQVVMTGTQEVRKVSIDPSLLQPGEREMLEDLLVAAFNVAAKKARDLAEDAQQGEISGMLGGLGGLGGGGMPDLGSLLGGGS